MGTAALISLAAFVASVGLTAAVRAIARRWEIVDRPDGQRKLHGRPVPLLGGAAVYGATALGLLAVHFIVGGSARFASLSTAWMVAAGFVCLVGCVDDCFNLPSRLKLALQILSVLPIVLSKFYIGHVVAFGCPIELGWLGVPLTVLWLVGCINALNLLDGMDGLASIVGLSTAAMLGVIAASEGQFHIAIMALTLAAALAGFLVFNLPPASIFLGDSGSMVIGLTIGVLGIQGALKTSATLAITAPAVMMTLPMFDVVAAVVRRRLTGRRFDEPDRLHIHHRLLARGWTPWQVLYLIGAICLTMGAAATAATIFRRDAFGWITAMTVVVLMIRLRLFGHDEFALAKETVIRGWKSSVGSLTGLVRQARVRDSGFRVLQPVTNQGLNPELRALPPEPRTQHPEPWDLFLDVLPAWNIRQVEFGSLRDGQQRQIRWSDPAAPVGEPCQWSISVSVPGRDGELCELRAAGSEQIVQQQEIARLTSLLKTFGTYFAAHDDQFFGPSVPATRKAA